MSICINDLLTLLSLESCKRLIAADERRHVSLAINIEYLVACKTKVRDIYEKHVMPRLKSLKAWL